jgi:hypothetical protein
MTLFINNELVLYSLCVATVCLITGFYIKSVFYSTDIETPSSPPTFNLNLEQLKEVQDILDKGDELNQETKNKLDLDFKEILGSDYDQFNQEISEIDDQFRQALQEIFTNLL